MKLRLKPTKQARNKKKIYGFDIETHGQKNNFLCASIYGEDYQETFYTKQEVIQAFQHNRFKKSIIAATNLAFDFFGIFNNTTEINNFRTLFRGSKLMLAKTHLDASNKYSFTIRTKKDKRTLIPLTFIDTLNYAMLSVDDMGKILSIPKLDFAEHIGKKPRTDQEWHDLVTYNLRDAEISQKFMKFLFSAFEQLGATPKATIAGTAMSLFKNKYLNDTYYLHNTNDLLEIMQGYYGGRTETFKRGNINNLNYYDINSMYPYCMTKQLPDPNTHRITHKNTLKYINEYEGMSKVNITCPEMKIPYLPFRWNNKLVFPTGTFTGWYTHYELRKAISIGYQVTAVHKTHYYTKTCKPLKEYAINLYHERLHYKNIKNPLQIAYKLLLNSLYGKFGQRFVDRETFTPASTFTYEEITEMKDMEVIGGFIKHKKTSDPAPFCIPIWASHITAYARDMLHDYLIKCDPYYADTDSIITKTTLDTSSELGSMKLEMSIKEGVIVKPKMYCLKSIDGTESMALKGVRKKVLDKDGNEHKLSYDRFLELMTDPSIDYKKFVQFKEALRRKLDVNEILKVTKELDLEDSKRDWQAQNFDFNTLQHSVPLVMIDGIERNEFKKRQRLALQAWKEGVQAEMRSYLDSDLFDKDSVGVDITDEEFLRNEIWHETQ